MFVRLRPIPISATPSQSLLYYLLHFSCYSPHLCYYLLHLGYCLPSAATQSISSAASCSICSYSLLLYLLLLFASAVCFCYSLLLLASATRGLLLVLALLLCWETYLSLLLQQIAKLAPPVRFTCNNRLAASLLGGTTQELSLSVCLLPRTDPYEPDPELDDDSSSSSELSSSSDFLSGSLDHSAARSTRLADTPVPKVGSLQAAAFLTLVMRLRQRHLGEHPHWPQHSELPPYAPRVNTPPGRTSCVLAKPREALHPQSLGFLAGDDTLCRSPALSPTALQLGVPI